MTWQYTVIGLIIGFIFGLLVMYPSIRKSKKQKALQQELSKTKEELDAYRQELVNHFARSAELLKSMANDYHQLHQHMVNSSSILLSTQEKESITLENNEDIPTITGISAKDNTDDNADSDKKPPRDYSGKPSGLLRAKDEEE